MALPRPGLIADVAPDKMMKNTRIQSGMAGVQRGTDRPKVFWFLCGVVSVRVDPVDSR